MSDEPMPATGQNLRQSHITAYTRSLAASMDIGGAISAVATVTKTKRQTPASRRPVPLLLLLAAPVDSQKCSSHDKKQTNSSSVNDRPGRAASCGPWPV